MSGSLRAGDGGSTADESALPAAGDWPPQEVQRLRARLGLSQAELAERVGTRQQTISEWETGTHAPRRMSRRLLHLVAEAAGLYATRGDDGTEPHVLPAPPPLDPPGGNR